MCGSDTLAIAVSSSSMNVARVTVIAISQGLISRFSAAGIVKVATWVAIVSPNAALDCKRDRLVANKIGGTIKRDRAVPSGISVRRWVMSKGTETRQRI